MEICCIKDTDDGLIIPESVKNKKVTISGGQLEAKAGIVKIN